MNKHQRLTGTATAGPGGAMTVEVGVITGDLTVATTDRGDGRATLEIQYTDADEWYTLPGSPVVIPDEGLDALHARTLDAVRAGGGSDTEM